MEYAYLDRFGILHAHPDKDTAVKYASWNERVIETDLPEDGGYIQTEGEDTFAYADTKEILIGGNTIDHGGKKLDDVPEELKGLLTKLGFYN